ncbi:PE domain-containing protein [Mycobacteroides chelonae]|uniref:PE domain-containing protein n=1 Tax=Mycobacteroides chelonae TaxID=1774 RepID=UPI0008A9B062|nr:PE domain-containing protein [Mycobacteroides chelonae]OHT95625.1 PE domain-containing protein [Mycobacteroides chelonae]
MVESLTVNAEALLSGGAAVAGVTGQQTAASAAATPLVAGLAPSGIDTVSMLASEAFSAEGVQAGLTAQEAAAMLGLAAEGMSAVGESYDAVDLAGAARVL